MCKLLRSSQKKIERAKKMLAMFAPGTIGVLSARCCSPVSALADRLLMDDLQAAGVSPYAVKVQTITKMQKTLPILLPKLAPEQITVVEQISGLFQNLGPEAFPILLMDGQIKHSGGTPGVEHIEAALEHRRAPTMALALTKNTRMQEMIAMAPMQYQMRQMVAGSMPPWVQELGKCLL
jgi:hypothetical protein